MNRSSTNTNSDNDTASIMEAVGDAIARGVATTDPADGNPVHSPAPTNTAHLSLRADQFADAAINAADRDGHRENLDAKADAASAKPVTRHNRAQRREARKALKRLKRMMRKLSAYSYQSEHVARYLLFTAAMILVDMASVVGASNNAVGDNGLLPWVMGVGIGVSIVSVGSAAGGLKREAHERAKRRDTPPKRLKDYPTLFGPDPVAGRWGDNLLAGGFVLVAAAIFVLRSVVAGGQLGIGYAAMGGLTLLGSYANSYLFGPFDKAAAVVRHLNSEKAQLRADRDAAEQNIEKAAGLATRPTSTKKIYRSEGKAAAALIQATVNHGIVLDHPSSFGIFEHDTAAAAAPMTPTTTPIQKRATRQPRAARKATDSGQGDGPVVGINSDGKVAVTGNGKAAK